MPTRDDILSDIFFVITGAVDVIKGISVLMLMTVAFPDQFSVLSVNIDIMSALIPFASPWVISFLQLSKVSRHRAYSRCAAALLVVGTLISIVYMLLSLSMIEESRDNAGLLIFLLLRMVSVCVLVFASLNQAYLMLLGYGRTVFWLQMGVWLCNIGLYLTLWLSGMGFSYVVAGLGMVAIDLALFVVGMSILKTSGNISIKPIRPSLMFSLKIRRIVLPELSTVASISLSGLLLSVVAFKIAPEDFADFRIPFAFQMACWMICARAAVLIIRRNSAQDSALFFRAIIYTFKVTWFVPFGLALIASVLVNQISPGQFIHSLVAMTYYPAMVIVISLNGVFRLNAMNRVISAANKWLLVFYFVPLSALIYFGYIGAAQIIHFVGISYMARLLLMYHLYRKRIFLDDNRCLV
ncbi:MULTISPECIES: hypothetical protein [unclassified Pseudomonas]|jgi:hypothetical protein|uniref:hypothetical protein n=1 Tax=unclassified Pseudomonas TaxID=196821 RepID=UPI0011A8BDC8|nr:MULTISPECIES: hypothetical protein [unclassified Pseudomonas]TWC22443.1 hypothetical protein FBY05_107238 [Pseudomonas sp. SJZ083]TWC48571.1 hypothetical protein FBY01_10725 [Pseudomonas sp. SJZ077]